MIARTGSEEGAMAETSLQLLEAMEAFCDITDAVTPEAAAEELDETSLQIFWRDWPHISAWAGSLWRQLDRDLAESASPSQENADTGGGD